MHTSWDIFQQAAFHTSLNGFPSMGARASLFDTGKNGTIINCTLFWNDLEYQHKNSTCQDLDELQGFSLYYMYSMSHTWGLKQNNILYPVSPNGDQHQFSPYNIHMLPREMVMRVNQMITEGKCSDLLSNSLNYCNSLRKCMKISMENLYVDIGT